MSLYYGIIFKEIIKDWKDLPNARHNEWKSNPHQSPVERHLRTLAMKRRCQDFAEGKTRSQRNENYNVMISQESMEQHVQNPKEKLF